MIDSPFLVKPGHKLRLRNHRTDSTGDFDSKKDARKPTEKLLEQLDSMQELLYANAEQAVLIVFQAMDTGGKDGAIEHVFSGINPQGCMVTSFKVPTHIEIAHDFLWRIHLAVPPRGIIGIFNRSHYESVLVERVKSIVEKPVWSRRYDRINEFERMLSEENVTIVKFFLHISKEEQKKRLQDRLDDKAKSWKFNPGDLTERRNWSEYMDAYQDALERCSTPSAPWYVIPADHKWFRNWAISDILVRTLKKLHLKPPNPAPGLDKIAVE